MPLPGMSIGADMGMPCMVVIGRRDGTVCTWPASATEDMAHVDYSSGESKAENVFFLIIEDRSLSKGSNYLQATCGCGMRKMVELL